MVRSGFSNKYEIAIVATSILCLFSTEFIFIVRIAVQMQKTGIPQEELSNNCLFMLPSIVFDISTECCAEHCQCAFQHFVRNRNPIVVESLWKAYKLHG